MAKNSNKYLVPILSIIAGIVIIARPPILAWVIGLYLVITGILKLADKY